MSEPKQPLPEHGPAGAPPQPPQPPPQPVGERRSRYVIALLPALVLLVGMSAYLVYTRVLRPATPAAAVASPPVPMPSPSLGNAPPTTAPGSPVATTATKAPTGGSTTTQAVTGPQIAYFRVQQQPSCPAGTTKFPISGQPVVIEWKVTAADSTELAVDGPGMYGSYGLEASETLSFPCEGEPGSYATHTYTLTTVGGGPTASRTLTVKALVNEIPVVD